MELVEVLLAILLIIASVLGLYLIKLVRRLFVTLDIVETELKELDAKITPLLLETQEMVSSGNAIVSVAKEQTDSISEVISGIKVKVGSIVKKSENISSPQSNANNLITNLRAFVKGATAFISELK